MSKYYFYLTDDERRLIIESLILKKNSLVSAGHHKATVKAQPMDNKFVDCAFEFVNYKLMFILSEQTILIATIEKQPTAR